MYTSMVTMMKTARENGYGIPAFSAYNEIAIRACISAAEEKNSPCLLICSVRGLPDVCYFGEMARDLAMRTRVPVAMVQDHGGTFESAIWAIRAGFTDIMIDRSTLPYEENISQVKDLVRIAHAVSVGVEAELGHVGSGNNYAVDGVTGLTDPNEAMDFVCETGVDTLAVAVGTAHGVYSGVPRIRFDLLEELRDKVPVPLVLHGGSGTGDENIHKACSLGICKVNLANDMYRGSIEELARQNLEGQGAYRFFSHITKGYKETAMRYMDVCGSSGKLSVNF